MMISAQVFDASVNVTSNSPSQDYTHPDDHNLRTSVNITPTQQGRVVRKPINGNLRL